MNDSELHSYLIRSGWSHIDRENFVRPLIVDMGGVGFNCSDVAKDFLFEYCGFELMHLPRLRIMGKMISSWTRFDPRLVCTRRDAQVAFKASGVAGVELFPIGVDSFHLTIFIGQDGYFYAGFDSSVYSYGGGVNEFFSNLRSGLRPVLVGDWATERGF